MNCKLERSTRHRRTYLSMSFVWLALLMCTSINSPAAAMGKLPSEAIADQLAEYRRVLLAYFKAFNLLPILLPAGQKPGDVFDMSQRGVLLSRADECFPGLVQPAAVPSALAYTFQLDSSKAGLALGLPQLGSVDLSGDFEKASRRMPELLDANELPRIVGVKTKRPPQGGLSVA